MRKLTTEEYIKKATEVHGNTYDYSDTIYKTSREKLTIKCHIHGTWECNPRDHLNGNGCPTCAIERRSKLRTKTTSEFIEEANKVHNNKYKYPNTVYINCDKKIKIECPTHGEFEQTPTMHVQGQGCKECFKIKLKNNPGTGWSRTSFKERCGDRLATFYILRCFNDSESFYKLGITANTVKRRYDSKKQMPYMYEVIHEIKGDAEAIFDLELKNKQLIKDYKYSPQIEFAGSVHECFTDISLIEI